MPAQSLINARYEIRGIVGRGGMGLVYKAHDKVIGRDVALKTLGDVHGRAALDMFYKEWRILANLHHPNIIEIFDIGEFEDEGVVKPFFVMPLLVGMTLEQALRSPGQQLMPDRLGEIVAQTCRGLQAIHDTGLVHRDIKPSNIFVMEFNSVKLIDFGVAHLVDSESMTGMKGTLSYMSPEQIQGQECTPSSDLFSLGVVCYEALCGVRPFQGKSTEEVLEAILNHIPQPVYAINPSVSQTVSRVIHKALAKQPRQRYQSALEFAEALQKALRGEPIAELDPGKIQPRIQRANRAFQQGNYEMAMDILSDLEASGHIDPALTPLRNQISHALRRKTIRDLIQRANMALTEEEYALALQNVESVLKMEPANEEAAHLRETIQAEMAHRDIDEWLRAAAESTGQYAFVRARQLLRNVLDLQPGNTQAAAMLQDLEAREQAYRAARLEKDELYKAANDAWRNSEFATAAAKLERVIDLERKAPDTATPESGLNYFNFLNLVRSAQSAIESVQTQVQASIAEGHHQTAIELCNDCIAKYPGHPVPQGLKLVAEAHQRGETLTRMAEIGRNVTAEPELEKKLDALHQASVVFPNEPLFEQWGRPIRDRLGLANGVVAKARAHEERGRFQEALEQWMLLRAIYPEMPGLEGEIKRVASYSGGTPVYVAQASTAASAPRTSPMAPAPLPPARPAAVPRSAGQPQPPASPISAAPKIDKGLAWKHTSATARTALYQGRKAAVSAGRGLQQLLPSRNSRVIAAVVAAAVLLLGSVAVFFTGRKTPPLPPAQNVATSPHPAAPVLPVSTAPLSAGLHLFADLQRAKIRLDNRDEVSLDESAFVAEDLVPGPHTLLVSNGKSEARIEFVIENGKAPELRNPIVAKELVAFTASDIGPTARIAGSPVTFKVAIDGKAPAEVAQGAYEFAGLAPGSHEVKAGEGKDARTFIVEAGNRPTLWIALFSDRNVGALLIKTGLEKFRVFLDGNPYNRQVRNGSMWVYNLAPKSYKLRVEADGFETPPEQDIAIKKGEMVNKEFTLTAVPQFATLIVRDEPARTQVLLDGKPLGTTDASGAFHYDKIDPAEHSIELRNSPQYKPFTTKKVFGKRETVQISGADARLERNPATVTISSTPEAAQFEWSCGQGTQRGRSPATATCTDNQITIKATLDGYDDQSKAAPLTPGTPQTVAFDMKRKAPVAPAPVARSCGAADLLKSGWTQSPDGYMASNNASFPCNDSAGTYSFAVVLPKKKIHWKFQGKWDFTLDKKSLNTMDMKVDITELQPSGAVPLRVVVDPKRAVLYYSKANSWLPAATIQGDFSKFRITFSKDSEIRTFSFTGATP